MTTVQETGGNGFNDKTNVVALSDPNTAILTAIQTSLDNLEDNSDDSTSRLSAICTDVVFIHRLLKLLDHHLMLGSGSNLTINDLGG